MNTCCSAESWAKSSVWLWYAGWCSRLASSGPCSYLASICFSFASTYTRVCKHEANKRKRNNNQANGDKSVEAEIYK